MFFSPEIIDFNTYDYYFYATTNNNYVAGHVSILIKNQLVTNGYEIPKLSSNIIMVKGNLKKTVFLICCYRDNRSNKYQFMREMGKWKRLNKFGIYFELYILY